ncbi:MAG: 3-isopropylmalate dehydratase large subunit [Gammaproteobacteria bacterium]
MPATLFDRLWDAHVVRDLGDRWALLHIDRHLLHELSGGPALGQLAARGFVPCSAELTFATTDHVVSSAPGRRGNTNPQGARFWRSLRERCAAHGIRYFELGTRGQGIVHVMGPELGLSLPGTTIVCGDSHTCTHGGVGALAFGIGSTEVEHVLATQALVQRRPRSLRLTIDGALGRGVTAKDVVLHAIGRFGTAAATDHAVEYAGSAVRAMSIDARLTLCNLSVEMGAQSGFVAPDATTFAYLERRPYAPAGRNFAAAVAHWETLHSDTGAAFDRELTLGASVIAPTVTWGTSPEHALAIDGVVPDPAAAPPAQAAAWHAALDYMGLEPGRPLAGTPVDFVFIGSCTNSRLSDLRAAAEIVRDRRVAPRVTAWVVPGSVEVKAAAEAEGLDRVFRAAGFDWREPGCSLCVAANGERVPPGARAVSTSNRNFVGRQGPGARTHLASPAMAAAAAVAGALVDVRTF